MPDELRQQAADDLADLVRKADTHLGTGFLATPDLLPVLADHGHLDLAYELLFQDTEPSWLAMIDRGATTVWERWEGIDDDGVPHESLNHYSKGAVDLVPAPVRRRPAAHSSPPGAASGCEPRPGGGITRASTEHLTPHGTARGRLAATASSFERHRHRARPAAPPRWCCPTARHEVGPGTHRFG